MWRTIIEEPEPFAFRHSLTEQIGGLMEAGFEITSIYKDCDGSGLFDQGGVFLIRLDYKDRRPIYEQLVERFAEMIRIGAVLPGEQLPSVRALAVEL